MIKQMLSAALVYLITLLARAVLRKYNPKIVVVTGSVGKTSAKDAIYTVLQSAYFARKSTKSFNSEFGVPLTVLDRPNSWSNPFGWLLTLFKGLFLILFKNPYPAWLVLEVGADKPGDLRSLMSWVKPDVVVVTRFPDVPVHVEFYDSIEALFAEEALPVFALRSPGVLVLNNDDERVRSFGADSPHTVITYGSTPSALVRSFNETVEYAQDRDGRLLPVGMKFEVLSGDRQAELRVEEALGPTHVYPLLAAVAVGLSLNIPLHSAAEALKNHRTPPGRMRLLLGVKGARIIDDTYNSSPVAAREALLSLGNVKAYGRKIAVLGDMRELGKYSEEEHRKIGVLVAEQADILMVVGRDSRFTAEGALNAGLPESNIFEFESAQEAGKFLEDLLGEGDVLLVKGSQSMRMERVVEEVMAHPEEKEKLLVRQEREWLAKA